MADQQTLLIVRRGSTRAADLLKVHNLIISKNLTLCHDVEMVAVTIVIGSAYSRALLLISAMRAEVSDHNNDRLVCCSSRSTAAARRFTGRCELIAIATPRSAPTLSA
jgi:hypothetical protein